MGLSLSCASTSASMTPTSAGSDRRSGLTELPGQGPLMYAELARHDRERRALLVPRGRQGNGLVGHLADHPPSSDTGLVEVMDHRRPMNSVPTGGCFDRRAVSIELDECIDLARRQPSLHRV